MILTAPHLLPLAAEGRRKISLITQILRSLTAARELSELIEWIPRNANSKADSLASQAARETASAHWYVPTTLNPMISLFGACF